MSLPPPPTDLDRLASAWLAFQRLWELTLPNLSAQLRAIRAALTASGGQLPPPPRPF